MGQRRIDISFHEKKQIERSRAPLSQCQIAVPAQYLCLFLSLERGRPVDVKVTEEGKDTFKCEYVAPVEGEYKVDVKFDGSPVPGSPFPVEVAKPGDAGKCKAQGDGLETATIDQLAEFDVDCTAAGKF